MSPRPQRIELLPRASLLPTGPVDHADWNYRPGLGRIIRMRYGLAVELLRGLPRGRLVEIGYGSGVFLPELARRSSALHGVDVHALHDAVAARLARQGVRAELCQASAERLPFETGSIDVAVAVSTLEFVPDIVAASAELHRVLAPGGALVLVMPGHSAVLDAGLALLTGENARNDFGDRRERVLPVLRARFDVVRELAAPRVAPRWLQLYRAFRLRPKPHEQGT